jgi:ABC-type transport system involved in cytochrome bd biosynthesis fused ATPase/permease subunit
MVEPREKIGIVGRTGSGKSSLIVALFRMVEPFKGQIVLDGIDLLSLGLQDVRGRVAAIPQVPVPRVFLQSPLPNHLFLQRSNSETGRDRKSSSGALKGT